MSKPTSTATGKIQRMLPPGAGFKAFKEGDGGEYSAAQRRAIKAEIAEAQKGPYHGPFRTAEEFARYFKAFQRRRSKSAAGIS